MCLGDSFSKIVAILLAVILMFIVPVFYMKEESMRLKQTRIIEEVTFFVDGVRNTGILSREDYQRLEKMLYNLGGGYRIYMSHYSHMMDEDNKEVIFNENADYEGQILDTFNKGEDYYLNKQDYLKIIVKDSEKNIVAWYGGSVKYEAH